MAVNNLAFLPFQGPSPVDNFLSAYAKGQDMQAQRANQERQQVVNQREDQTYAQDQKTKAIETLGAVLVNVKNADEFEQVKGWSVQTGLIDANEAQNYSFANLPQLLALSEKARQSIAQRAAAKLAQDKFDLDRRSTEANIRQSDAAAAASRANADYIRGGKMGGGAGGKFGAGGKPLTERESKDLSWALRGQEANTQFTPDRIEHLINARNVIGRNVPLIGNKLQTDQSRQAVQTAKNFVAVVLRKDTGAAVTEKEFDFYEDIFIPAWGDDPGTLQMKAQARGSFLNALRQGLGPRSALAQLGVTPPEGLAPPEDDKTSVIESQGGWSATVEE